MKQAAVHGSRSMSASVGRRSPSTSSTSSSIRSRASGLSASRYHIHDIALAVVSCPASMKVAASSRTRCSGSGSPVLVAHRQQQSEQIIVAAGGIGRGGRGSRPRRCRRSRPARVQAVERRRQDRTWRTIRAHPRATSVGGLTSRISRVASSAARSPSVTVGPIWRARSAIPRPNSALPTMSSVSSVIASDMSSSRRGLAAGLAAGPGRSRSGRPSARTGSPDGAWPAPG